MEKIDLRVKIVELNETREFTTSYGFTHLIVEGEIEDDTGKMKLTVWNEQIEEIKKAGIDNMIDLEDCFITSFKGTLSVNVGRDSKVIIP